MKNSGTIISLTLFLLLGQLYALPEEPIFINGANEYTLIGKQTYWLEENVEHYNIDEVTSIDDFKPGTDPVLNWGFTNSSYWIKVPLKNTTSEELDLVMEVDFGFNHRLECYIPEELEKYTIYISGTDYPYQEQEFASKNPVYPIHLGPGESKTILLHATSDGKTLSLPISIWKRDRYIEHSNSYQIMNGLFYGLILLIFLINLFLYIAIKDLTYLYYIVYVISFGLVQFSFDGYAQAYLWSEKNWLANRSVPLFGTLATIAVIMFTRSFFKVAGKYRLINKIFFLMIWATVVFTVALLFPNPFYIVGLISINLMAFLEFFPVIIVAMKETRIGYRPASYFLAAFIFLFLGIVFFSLGNVGLLHNSFLTNFGMKIGSGLEMVILSFSLAVRFKTMREENEKAKEAQLSQLEEKNKLVHELNLQLEDKVRERSKQLADKNKDITDSINYAKRIQEAILPNENEIKSAFTDSFILFRPKDIVSGDFYWFAERDGLKVIAAADCTGHGVPGAFMSMVGSNLLNHIIIEEGITQPGRILDLLREGVISSLKQKDGSGTQDGMDISICTIDIDRQMVQYAGANNPLYVIKSEVLEEIKPDKQPVGIYHGELKPFRTQMIKLRKGEAFYLFSDGYADQFGGPKGKKFKYKRLKELLVKAFLQPMQEQKKLLENELEEWKADTEQVDDICIIGIRL